MKYSCVTLQEKSRLILKDFEFKRTLPDQARRIAVQHLLSDPFEHVIQVGGHFKEIIFIHVPKTAGTSFFRSFDRKALHIPLSRYYAADKERAKNTPKIAFVRDPKERLHSAYNYLYSQIGANRSLDVRWAEEVLSPYPTFQDFLVGLQNRRFRRRILRWTHFRPQVSWIKERPGGGAAIDFLGRFEQLEDDTKELENYLGISVELPHARKPRRPRENLEIPEKLEMAIRDIYWEDYNVLGYE